MTLKEFKKNQEKEMLRLLLLKWLCDKHKWAAKHMHELSNLFSKEFTTKDIPLKSSRSYELIKEWEKRGLIRVIDYTTKAKKYAFTSTLFARLIVEQSLDDEEKQALLELVDSLV